MIEKSDENSNEMNSAAFSPADPHLSDEQLIAYQDGIFADREEESRIQNHLADCRRCTNLYLELVEFTQTAADLPPTKSLAAQWNNFAEKIGAATIGAEENVEMQTPPEASRTRGFFNLFTGGFAYKYAAAFGLLLAVLAGALFIVFRSATNDVPETTARVEPREAEIKRPANETVPPKETDNSAAPVENSNTTPERAGGAVNQNNGSRRSTIPEGDRRQSNKTSKKNTAAPDELALSTADIELYPDETVRGGTDAPDLRIIRLKPGVARLRLKLIAPPRKSGDRLTVEISDAAGKLAFAGKVASPSRGNLVLSVPAQNLPAQTYAVKIYASAAGTRTLFAQYSFELEFEK